MSRRLAILDVGHGNSAVLEDRDGVVVIDAGLRNGLLDYLTEQGITVIDVVLISHADADHVGGLIGLLSSKVFDIKQVRLNSDAVKDSKLWDDLMVVLDDLRSEDQLDFSPALTPNDTGTFDQGPVHIEIIGPSSYLAGKGPGSMDRRGRKISTNSVSAVIRLVEHDAPIVLFAGDMDMIGLQEILEHDHPMNAPLLVFPHHGGRPGRNVDPILFVEELCASVSPRMIIFSIGRNKRGFPRPETMRAILETDLNIRIACTQLSGACARELPRNKPVHLNDVFAMGRELNRCCAGTIVLSLEDSRLYPAHDVHQAFIDESAPTALCRDRKE